MSAGSHIRLKDVPVSPAYLVSHDVNMNGAMDVWGMASLAEAENEAKKRQEYCEARGDDWACYRAYAKLPRVKVWKYWGVWPKVAPLSKLEADRQVGETEPRTEV